MKHANIDQPNLQTSKPRRYTPNIWLMTFVGIIMFAGCLFVINNTVGPQKPVNVVTTPHVSAAQPDQPIITGNPVRFQVPSLGMDLTIVNGYYNKQTREWSLSRDKVQYATVTPEPNNKAGNTFLYGHFRREVFAPLHKIQADSEAIVSTDTGHTFYYRLNAVKVVAPDDPGDIFSYQGKPILTVQTCTGSFYQDRQLFIFDLVKVV